MKTVCLLTAGTGTRMGKYAGVINKTLLPINDKAIISHIIEQFPKGTKFVVALGFMGDTVKTYLELAHSDLHFEFVKVENFEGPGSGPAHSLTCCKPHLTGPFTLIACDAVYGNLNNFPTGNDYLGVSKVEGSNAAYCNVRMEGPLQIITDILDKQECDLEFAANGVFHFHHVDTFWKNLDGVELSSGYRALTLAGHICDWADLGTFEKYQSYYLENSPYDFSKTDEFLYIVGDKVIKWFKDENIAANRVARSKMREGFPEVTAASNGFYSYTLVPGKTLYQYNNVEVFGNLIKWLNDGIWKNQTAALSTDATTDFYLKKTLARLHKFVEKYPDFNPTEINGKPVALSMTDALNKKVNWRAILMENLEERSRFIHGDLQFDNILFDGEKFTLLDWRQDFAGDLQVGDIYYDAAKLRGGMIINYDMIKKNLFSFEEKDGKCFFDIPLRRNGAAYACALDAYFPSKVIDQITSLIFLNMAPLHAAPFDKLLYCLALERLNEIT